MIPMTGQKRKAHPFSLGVIVATNCTHMHRLITWFIISDLGSFAERTDPKWY